MNELNDGALECQKLFYLLDFLKCGDQLIFVNWLKHVTI